MVSGPLISILIPCFNAAPWIEEALRSAQAQSWPRTEIIVVDDGSTDESFTISRKFAASGCEVIRQERRGASAARNRALALAQGEYIQYLDADDFLAANKLQRQMETMRERGTEVLCFGSAVHFFDSPKTGEKHLHPAGIGADCAESAEFLAELWNENRMVQTGQWLTPRTLIEKAGPWNEQLSVDDDGEFFTRVILAAGRIVPEPKAWTYYRKFRRGPNLSAAAHRNRSGRLSAMRAALLKSAHLLSRRDDEPARRAVSRIVTREIIASHPAWPELVADGVDFLQARDLPFDEAPEGSPWFLRLSRRLGWKTARRLQWHYRRWRSAAV